MSRKGFTIVELLMVVGILAVLMTIVTTAATGAIKQARSHKADTIVKMVESGIATYYAQYDQWPSFDPDGKTGNYRVSSGSVDADRYLLTDSEADDLMRELIRKSVGASANPLLDVMGLFVARSGNVSDKTYGLDFQQAIRGTKRSPKKMKIGDMMFGYPDLETGRFRRFKIIYSIPSDQISVTK